MLDLSDRIGLSPTPVARRMRNLEAAGIISSYAAMIDETALDYPVSVFVSVKLDRQVDQALAEFEAFLPGRLTRFPAVSSIESSIPLRRVKAGISRQPLRGASLPMREQRCGEAHQPGRDGVAAP